MSKASFTPGPWRADGVYVWSRGPHGGNVCVCGEPRASGFVDYEPITHDSKQLAEANANAALIASTPELLAERDRLRQVNAELMDVAKLFVRSIKFEISKDRKNGDDEGARLKTVTLNMVRAVIARATGATS